MGYPMGILAERPENLTITNLGKSFHSLCYQCIFTDCITSALDKQYSVFMNLKRPLCVMLPVDMHDDPWFNNSALQILKIVDFMLQPKHFVFALILWINVLIGILTSLAVSTTALVSKVKTANFVNDLSKNVLLALTEQQIIDKKLKT